MAAAQVVGALNAWADELFPELAGLIVPTRGHVVLTAPVDVNQARAARLTGQAGPAIPAAFAPARFLGAAHSELAVA